MTLRCRRRRGRVNSGAVSPGGESAVFRHVRHGSGPRVHYRGRSTQQRLLEDHVGRDTEAIERDIENARNQLASTLDELSVRTNPKKT